MDKTRNLTPDGVLLKERFCTLVDACGGSKRTELLTRVGVRTICEYGNPGRPEVFAPVDVVAQLEKVCGQHPVTEAMALIGGGFFTKPAVNVNTQQTFGAVMPAIGRDMGELIKDAYAAGGGQFNAATIIELRGDIQGAISSLALALSVLENVV